MKILSAVFTLFLITSNAIGQVNEKAGENMLQIDVADSISNPIIMVLHSMGDVNVKGHKGAELLIYAQELLPSVSDLVKQNKTEVFTFIDRNTASPITVSQNNNFSVQQSGNYFQIETNIFSFNNHVYVMAPERSSVGVHSRDIGNIIIENFEGDIEVESNVGNIYLKDIEGTVNAATSYGNVIADYSEEEKIKPLFVSTFIGNIEIIAPEQAKNTVLLSSGMGNLRSNFDTVNTISVSNTNHNSNNRQLTFELNGGGTEIILNTFKGDIYLRHNSLN